MPDWPAPTEETVKINSSPPFIRPRPLRTLLAAATKLTGSKSINSAHVKGGGASTGWQADAWDAFDQVGEERFLATTLAGRMAQARFFVGVLNDDPNEPPSSVSELPEGTDPGLRAASAAAMEAFATLNDSPTAMGQRVSRMGVNLFVAGEVMLVGIPRYLLDPVADRPDPADGILPGDGAGELELGDLDWRVLSVDEIDTSGRDGMVVLRNASVTGDDLSVSGDDLAQIRIWRPHPRHWWEPDSPTRSSLPVLRELIGLTMHVSAQVTSRLAGAGLLLVPQEAEDAVRAQAGGDGIDASDSPFTDALVEGMVTPIGDRSNASAVVPLTLTVPGDTIEQFRYLSFNAPLDAEARELRDEAIRRLALGQDAPPELLLGVGGMNHWGAWLVREDVVTTHLEPPLALICDALTTQFLWPVLEQQGVNPELAERLVVWYSVEHMIVRPNRGQDAVNLYDRGELSGRALRDETGFSESDAPKLEDSIPIDVAVETALDMLRAAPSLAQTPGLPALVAQIREVLGTAPAGSAPVPGEDEDAAPDTTGEGGDDAAGATEGDIPATSDDPGEPGGAMAAVDALKVANDDH